jgi:hypothetical protein
MCGEVRNIVIDICSGKIACYMEKSIFLGIGLLPRKARGGLKGVVFLVQAVGRRLFTRGIIEAETYF